MSIEKLSDKKISRVVLEILEERPYRLVDLRKVLKDRGYLVSYTRLKKVVTDLLEEGSIMCFKYGKSVMYIKKEKMNFN